MSLRDKPAFAKPASPIEAVDSDNEGMTLREYAAIKLKVPDSGDEELDAMIRKSRRQELAGLAMQGILSSLEQLGSFKDLVAREAREMADALIAELDKGEDNAS